MQLKQEVSLESAAPGNVILFGGTFEPPHIGHLVIARVALERTGADEVWFIPALSPPHKDDVALDYQVRAQMVASLIEDIPGLRLSNLERRLPSPSYTVDTVRTFIETYPETNFTFLIGTDSLAGLPAWHQAGELSEQIGFIVAARTGFPFSQTYERALHTLPQLQAHLIEMPLIDLSSSWLRERMEAGNPLCGLVPEGVLDIWRNALRP